MQDLKLYTYSRSSASYRVRIALNVKGLPWKPEYVHLIRDGGQEKLPAYRNINPQQLVPSFTSNGDVITQSLAIIEYLDEVHPQPALLPSEPMDRAYVRSLAYAIACDIHPLNNLRVLKYLEDQLGTEKKKRDEWYCHWIKEGFSAIEQRLIRDGRHKAFCLGDVVSLADLCLIPQVYNARRFHCDMAAFPVIDCIYKNCMELAAFKHASPEEQGDYEV